MPVDDHARGRRGIDIVDQYHQETIADRRVGCANLNFPAARDPRKRLRVRW
jgi:hypothetical protein